MRELFFKGKSSKKVGSIVLALAMVFALMPLSGETVKADEPSCSEELLPASTTWNAGKINPTDVKVHCHSDGTIHVFGSGAMKDYEVPQNATDDRPWGYVIDNTSSSAATALTIDVGVTSIGDNAFKNFQKLTSVTIPSTVTSIGESAFIYCKILTSITISNNVTSIGSKAFQKCESLTSVTIPNSVTSIGNDAFYGCEALENVTLSTGLTSIKSATFYGCKALTSITIPNGVTAIDESAFYNCKALTSVTIPNTVISIGDEAFQGCSNLTSITIPNSVTTIGDEAFHNCDELISVTLGNSLQSIGSMCFTETKIQSIIIPASLTSIATAAFAGCPSLTNFSVNASNAIYKASNDGKMLYSLDGTTLVCYPSASGDVTIPSNVTAIADWAFAFSGEITSVTIPNGVNNIGGAAFYCCLGLKNVIFTGSSLPATIGTGAFVYAGYSATGAKTIYVANTSETERNTALATLKSGEGAMLSDDWVVAEYSSPPPGGGGNNNSNTETSNSSNESTTNENSSNEASTDNSGKAVITEAVKATATTPAVAINVAKPAETVALTDAEKSAISSGKDVNIFVEVSDANVPSQDVAAMKRVTSNNSMKYGQSLDIDLYSMIAGDASTKRAITSTEVDIPVTVSVPASLQKHGRYFWVVRNHNGKTEILPATYDENSQTITFATRLFSSYAIVYSDVPLSPSTGETTPVYPILAVLVAGALGLLVANRKKFME